MITNYKSDIEWILRQIENYGLSMIIVLILGYFLFIFFKYQFNLYKKSKNREFQLLQRNVDIEKQFENLIKKNEMLEAEIKEIKERSSLNSLKYHEIFSLLKHHIATAETLDFGDDYKNFCMRTIVRIKLQKILTAADYLLQLENIYNIDNLNTLSRITLTDEIDDLIKKIIKEYNDEILLAFRNKFNTDKQGSNIKSDCGVLNCTKSSVDCNKNLGDCIFNKIMNDPIYGFNKWHQHTVTIMFYNLKFDRISERISNVRLVNNTLCEFSKAGTSVINELHRSFDSFNGDLTRLYKKYDSTYIPTYNKLN